MRIPVKQTDLFARGIVLGKRYFVVILVTISSQLLWGIFSYTGRKSYGPCIKLHSHYMKGKYF